MPFLSMTKVERATPSLARPSTTFFSSTSYFRQTSASVSESSCTERPCSSRNAACESTSSRETPKTTVSSFANSCSRSLKSIAWIVQPGVPSRG